MNELPVPPEVMEFEVRMNPASGTAGLLRLVSVLHGRGLDVFSLRYFTGPESLTAFVSVDLGHRGGSQLKEVLRRMIQTEEVVGPRSPGSVLSTDGGG